MRLRPRCSAHRAAGLAALALVAGACAPAPRTQLVVAVEVEPALRPLLGPVTLVVRSATGSERSTTFVLADVPGLPTLGVVHESGPLEGVRVEVTSHVSGTPIADRAITDFVAGQTRLLTLRLAAGCVGVPCAVMEHCVGATCVDARRPGTSLPVFSGTPEPTRDAGVRDAASGVDFSECFFDWDCGIDEHCRRDGTHPNECVAYPSAVSGGDSCGTDVDCHSGSCDTSAGFCRYLCMNNEQCLGGELRCVVTDFARGTGACMRPTGESGGCPPGACEGPTEACVSGTTPVCTPGPLCTGTIDCGDGEDCVFRVDSGPFADIGYCVTRSPAGLAPCGPFEVALETTGGAPFCTGGEPCDPGHECLGGESCESLSRFGLDPSWAPQGEGICARPR